jgi:hypothetical protein
MPGRKTRHPWVPSRKLIILLLLAAATLLIGACATARWYEAALVLADIAAGTGKSRLKAVTGRPTRTQVNFTVSGRGYTGDLYRPAEGALAGLLLLPGAAEGGKDDPRLVAFANSLARARFSVLVPDLAGLRSLKIGSRDIGETADAFAWLVSQPELAPGGRAGIWAFSYAAGPAVLAALDPRIRDRTRFLFTVGGYHDLRAVLTFFTTGWYRENGQWKFREPNLYGKWVFVLSNIDRLSDPADRALFEAMAKRRMDDLGADVADLTAGLGPEGKRFLAFIENSDPAKVVTLLEGLPGPIRQEIAALNLAGRNLHLMKARMIIVHGYDDDIIPFTESVALARALPPEQRQLFLVRGLMHVDLKPGAMDAFRLWRGVNALLRERKGALVESPITLKTSDITQSHKDH